MGQPELLENARWGCLPFDIFVLENWDYNSPDDRATQWVRHAKSFISLGAEGRHPYNAAAAERRASLRTPDPFPGPSEHEITQILQPSQTVQERNISGAYPVLLRTCYLPGSDSRFDSLLATCTEDMETTLGPLGDELVLDDETRYDFGDDWEKIFNFLPELVGRRGPLDVPDEDAVEERKALGSNDERGLAVVRASYRITSHLFVVDEEAMRTGWTRLLWLGERGEAVWENRWLVGEMQSVRALLDMGYMMYDVVQYKEGKVGGDSGEYLEWAPGEEVPLAFDEDEEKEGEL